MSFTTKVGVKMNFFNWTEITAFYNVRKSLSKYPELLSGNSAVIYKAKVKLHGTNAAVQCHGGEIVVQSRTQIITPNNDNAGFAKFVYDNKEPWTKFKDIIIYGEWCGSGIQSGVAISAIGKKIFAVFAIRSISDESKLIFEPEEISNIIGNIPDVYVLPWSEKSDIEINWNLPTQELEVKTSEINIWVLSIEKNDPWVQKTFNVSGLGEGLVFYPVSKEHSNYTGFKNLAFKAKGEKHKNIKSALPAQVNPEVLLSANAFVDSVLTDARLNQAAQSVGSFDIKLTGHFVKWIIADIQKECQDELEASNLSFDDVSGMLNKSARNWFVSKCREL